MDNGLGVLGIARKAGRVEAGEEPTGAAARAGKASALFTASDISGNSLRRARGFAEAGKAPMIELPFSKGEIGAALGRTDTVMFAITDTGLAAAFLKRLAASDPENYSEASALMEKRAETLRLQSRSTAKRTGLGRRRKKI